MTSDPSKARILNAGSIVSASNYVAGSTAVLGAAFGAGYATLKGRPVVLWTVVAGGQCGALGWTFWFTRSILRQNAQRDTLGPSLSQREELMYSGLAGSFSGLVGGAFRGRANMLPGAIAMGLVGIGGQLGYNALSLAEMKERDQRPLLDRLSDSKWWPLKTLSDEEYEHDLTEKLIAIEAEVSMIDDRLKVLKQVTSTVKP